MIAEDRVDSSRSLPSQALKYLYRLTSGCKAECDVWEERLHGFLAPEACTQGFLPQQGLDRLEAELSVPRPLKSKVVAAKLAIIVT